MTADRSDAAPRDDSALTPDLLLSDRLRIDPGAWIAPGAVLVGEVSIAEEASVWYGCVVRGDLEPVRIGRQTNVQDLSVVHVDRGMPAILGKSAFGLPFCLVFAFKRIRFKTRYIGELPVDV